MHNAKNFIYFRLRSAKSGTTAKRIKLAANGSGHRVSMKPVKEELICTMVNGSANREAISESLDTSGETIDTVVSIVSPEVSIDSDHSIESNI